MAKSKQHIIIDPELKPLINKTDTSHNSSQTLKHITPNLLERLRYSAMIESIGASTRMAGAKLSDHAIETLLSDRLELKMEHERIIHASLPPLAAEILQLIQNKVRATMADIVQATNAPRSTIKKHLGVLIDQKYLIRHGQGRGTWYTQT